MRACKRTQTKRRIPREKTRAAFLIELSYSYPVNASIKIVYTASFHVSKTIAWTNKIRDQRYEYGSMKGLEAFVLPS